MVRKQWFDIYIQLKFVFNASIWTIECTVTQSKSENSKRHSQKKTKKPILKHYLFLTLISTQNLVKFGRSIRVWHKGVWLITFSYVMFMKATQLREFIELHFEYIRWTVFFFFYLTEHFKIDSEIELNFIGYKSIVGNFSTYILVFLYCFYLYTSYVFKHILVNVTTIDKNTSKNK